jgi:hypothetical protein
VQFTLFTNELPLSVCVVAVAVKHKAELIALDCSISSSRALQKTKTNETKIQNCWKLN